MSHTQHVDVVVVGGGPAGASLAALVARRGHRVILLEREVFPRYQIGESLLPSTVHGICRLLGVHDKLGEAGFTVKHGGTFRWGSNPQPWTFAFAASERLAGPTSFAYQVERMKFDQILLDNAKASGVDVREACTVTAIAENDDRVTGVRYRDDGGNDHEILARYTVDASGNTSRIHTGTGGRREMSPFFRNIALFGYYEGGKRLPAPRSGNILSAAFADGWFWYIPLSPRLTSVGAVVSRRAAHRVQGDPEQAMSDLIASCPLIADYLSDASRVTSGTYGRLRVRKDYSYCDTRFWRPGMVLIGDAACFVDPVFSSGVHLATYSALLAARSINTALNGSLPEQRLFAEFEARYRREYRLFYEFLLAFYEMQTDEQSYFWQAQRVTKSAATQLEAFVELVGGVASDEAALARTTAHVGRRVRTNATEMSAAVADPTPGQHVSMLDKQGVAEVLTEGARMQAHALLGAEFEDKAIFDGGLSATPDSLGWRDGSE